MFFAIWSNLHISEISKYFFIKFCLMHLKEITNWLRGGAKQIQNQFAADEQIFAAKWRWIKRCWLKTMINFWNWVYQCVYACLTILGGVLSSKMLCLQEIAAFIYSPILYSKLLLICSQPVLDFFSTPPQSICNLFKMVHAKFDEKILNLFRDMQFAANYEKNMFFSAFVATLPFLLFQS